VSRIAARSDAVFPREVRDLQFLDSVESIPDFEAFGIHAFTTTRATGSFGSGSDEPVRDVIGRWDRLRKAIAEQGVTRLATSSQVHAADVVRHVPGWDGWLRCNAADGHVSRDRGTALAVTIADCVPVFLAHPSGAAGILHSGWRGTAARIVERGIAELDALGAAAKDLLVHLGPAVCGQCYQVSPEVIAKLTGRIVTAPETVDLRALIADHARAVGVRNITISSWCTRHDNARFFSHRAGDPGRQIAVIYALSG
jgi:polyphenol oxidase